MERRKGGRGKIFTFEGTDSSGKLTQSELLKVRLLSEGIKVKTMSFPRYNTPTGRIIGQCYLGKKDLGEKLGWQGDYSWFGDADKADPMVISPLYAIDRKAAMPEIRGFLREGGNWILDRWTGSNQGHQAGKIRDSAKRFEMIKYIEELEQGLLKLSRPDITFFLYMPLEYSIELRKKRDGGVANQDGHENNLLHLKHAEESYLELYKMYDWTKIDCVNGGKIRIPRDIHEEIYSIVKPRLALN